MGMLNKKLRIPTVVLGWTPAVVTGQGGSSILGW
jgi:hypothetical protein